MTGQIWQRDISRWDDRPRSGVTGRVEPRTALCTWYKGKELERQPARDVQGPTVTRREQEEEEEEQERQDGEEIVPGTRIRTRGGSRR